MQRQVFSLFNPSLNTENLNAELSIVSGKVTVSNFPDAETYIRIDSDVKGADLIVIDSLNNPNEKILALLFFISAARELGAKSIGLVSPYLPYMRQDISFSVGEAVTSKYFAHLLSTNLDWLVTVDPHLHRYKHLSEIYNIPTEVVHANTAIAKWINSNVTKPLLVGPDIESTQWVKSIAEIISAPHIILEKHRISATEVSIILPNLDKYASYTPVLIDDIISTGNTMLETIKKIKDQQIFPPPVCIGVHAIFVADAYTKLQEAGAKIVTCNTVKHISNQIDVMPGIIGAILKLDRTG